MYRYHIFYDSVPVISNTSVICIRIGCNEDSDPGSTSASIRIQEVSPYADPDSDPDHWKV